MITDEFSSFPVSRQRKYQLRKKAERACAICGDKNIVNTNFCIRHTKANSKRRKKRYKKRKDNGQCVYCGTPHDTGGRFCEIHRVKLSKYMSSYYRRKKSTKQ